MLVCAGNIESILLSVAVAVAAILVVVYLLVQRHLKKVAIIKARNKKKEKAVLDAGIVLEDMSATEKINDKHAPRYNPFGRKHKALPSGEWEYLSFEDRLYTLSEEGRTAYMAVHNLLCKHFTQYNTDICEVYFNAATLAARLVVYRGEIRLFLALDPEKYDQSEIPFFDVSYKEGYAEIPMLVRFTADPPLEQIEKLIRDIISA